MRLLAALGLALLSALGAAVMSAIVLGLLANFSELGRVHFQKEVFHGPVLHGGYDDLILVILTLIAFLAGLAAGLRRP